MEFGDLNILVLTTYSLHLSKSIMMGKMCMPHLEAILLDLDLDLIRSWPFASKCDQDLTRFRSRALIILWVKSSIQLMNTTWMEDPLTPNLENHPN